ncbi:MAG TPA: substrate-binding domain-containing protein [Phycisphaerae bacterium]|nr:substrate-binding domain-containing protein [Phycisphaerae bacterium]
MTNQANQLAATPRNRPCGVLNLIRGFNSKRQPFARVSVLGLFIALLFGTSGCEKPERLLPKRSSEGFIAVVGNVKDDPVWHILAASAERYRAGLGEFELKIFAADADAPSAQTRLLRQIHDPKMRGLCIWPSDVGVMRDILLDLRTKGVPVVTMMTPIPYHEPFPYSGLDEIAVGRALASAAFEAVDGDGTVALLKHGGDSVHHADRYLGFSERAAEVPSMIVLSEFECLGNEFVGQRLVRDYVERFPRLNAMVTLDDWALRGLKSGDTLLPGGCKLITYGPYPDYWPMVNSGSCYALVGARYDRIAERALQMCVTLARGEVLEISEFFAEPITVKQSNLKQFRIDWFHWLEKK